jgi:hypothetical protein
MAEVINLRQARKAKARSAKENAAEQNRIRFGQTKAEKARLRLEEEQKAALLDGHKRDREGEES